MCFHLAAHMLTDFALSCNAIHAVKDVDSRLGLKVILVFLHF